MHAKAQQTKERILDAALSIFSQKGYHDTRMDDIVDESGSSKGAVYFHFPGKEQLFLALVDEFASRLESRLSEAIAAEEGGMRRVEAALEAGLAVFGEYRRLAKLFLVQAVGLGQTFETKRLQILDKFAHLIQKHLDEAIADGDILPLDSQITAYAWVGAINELIMRWVQNGEPTPERIAPALRTTLLNSIQFAHEKVHHSKFMSYNPLALLNALAGQPRWAWITPEESLIAWGEAAMLKGERPEDFRSQLDELIQKLDISSKGDIRLFGAFPFDMERETDSIWAGFEQPTFVLPRYIYRQTPTQTTLTEIAPDGTLPPSRQWDAPPLTPATWKDDLDFEKWEEMVNIAKESAKSDEIGKVVFARTRKVSFEELPELTTVFSRLNDAYPATFRFYFEPRPGLVFMGATPELLVRTKGRSLETVALAGSAPRSNDEALNAQYSAALLASKKDQREHAIVIEDIVEGLTPLCSKIDYAKEPQLRFLPNIQHLETPIKATLKEAGIFAPVQALHPTPALAGQPRPRAMEMIREHEPKPRGGYGAPVGWISPSGDGEMAVAIRSAVFRKKEGYLYAGGGLLAASDPAKEWQETIMKFRPMMDALGLEEKR
ncbi:MAG: isochorismate synthase [Anaerolineae bacterium]|jgi:menaquinone-specific isochorismate synthase|nr:isochorismate synthase [Anaerolineae bacterium]MBT7070908.1 isochorismate synthase [Anaerolineae bacterium]MBT7324334.1 isochorismate synthase [Anaerolineae bacterium]